MKGKGKDMSKVELTETQKNIIQIRNGEILATSHKDKTTFIVILHRLHTNE